MSSSPNEVCDRVVVPLFALIKGLNWSRALSKCKKCEDLIAPTFRPKIVPLYYDPLPAAVPTAAAVV
jgi:hypothetical protein